MIENASEMTLIAFCSILSCYLRQIFAKIVDFVGKIVKFKGQTLYDDIINDVITWCNGSCMHNKTSIHHSDCLQNILSAFNAKSKFKNAKNSIGAFEKHADDVTSSCPILPKMSEVVRK